MCDDCIRKRLDSAERTLDNINTLMCESFMVRDYPFGRMEGALIMDHLDKWMSNGEQAKGGGA